MNFKISKIYPITDTVISGLSHPQQVERLIAGGAELIQLRDKRSLPNEFYNSAKAAVEIANKHGVKIMINDRVDIALAVKADGVHLGQDDLPPIQARAILGPNAIIGFSTHTIDQVTSALKLPIDYIAFGPIFNTQTKVQPDTTVGTAMLSSVRSIVKDFPLVAIGGIKANDIVNVFNAGADSVALISAILGEPESITARMAELVDLCNN